MKLRWLHHLGGYLSLKTVPFANKNNGNSLGKSSTNMRTLSMRLTNLTQEVSPVPKCGRTRSNPVARLTGKSTFVTRAVRVLKSIPTTADSVNLTCADVSSALSADANDVAFRVQALKVWNMTPAGQTSNYLSVATASKLFTSGTTNVTVTDVGTASHLPGVYVNVPNTLTQLNTATSDVLLTVDCRPTSTTLATAQTVCFDVYVLYRSAA